VRILKRLRIHIVCPEIKCSNEWLESRVSPRRNFNTAVGIQDRGMLTRIREE
jgi:hypothetical protein